jgi:hypothetical protein
LAALGSAAGTQSVEFKPNQRYPDASVQILDPSFAKYRLYSSSVEQLATGAWGVFRQLSDCRSAAKTCASVARRTTACSGRAAIRSTQFTSKPAAPSKTVTDSLEPSRSSLRGEVRLTA